MALAAKESIATGRVMTRRLEERWSTGSLVNLFDLTGRVAVITGGAGLLGEQHARAIAVRAGYRCWSMSRVKAPLKWPHESRPSTACRPGAAASISPGATRCQDFLARLVDRFGRLDILINNAANNPRVEDTTEVNFSRFENFPWRSGRPTWPSA